MKSLLTLTALIEVAIGLSLIAIPSVTSSLLLGVSLIEPSGILVGRIGGAALISLAITCWLSRNERHSSLFIAKALVFYNTAAAFLLVYGVMAEKFSGLSLWPAAILHVVLLIWCIKSIWSYSSTRV
jgi:hypothetical protein